MKKKLLSILTVSVMLASIFIISIDSTTYDTNTGYEYQQMNNRVLPGG